MHVVGTSCQFRGALPKIVRQIEGGTRQRGHISQMLPKCSPLEPMSWIAITLISTISLIRMGRRLLGAAEFSAACLCIVFGTHMEALDGH